MPWMDYVKVGGVIVQVFATVIAAVWAIAKIKSATVGLSLSVDGLRASTVELKNTTHELSRKVSELGERVARVEGYADAGSCDRRS